MRKLQLVDINIYAKCPKAAGTRQSHTLFVCSKYCFLLTLHSQWLAYSRKNAVNRNNITQCCILNTRYQNKEAAWFQTGAPFNKSSRFSVCTTSFFPVHAHTKSWSGLQQLKHWPGFKERSCQNTTIEHSK